MQAKLILLLSVNNDIQIGPQKAGQQHRPAAQERVRPACQVANHFQLASSSLAAMNHPHSREDSNQAYRGASSGGAVHQGASPVAGDSTEELRRGPSRDKSLQTGRMEARAQRLEEKLKQVRVEVALRPDQALSSFENSISASVHFRKEIKRKREIWHLFQPKEGSNIIYICNLKSKKIKEYYCIEFKFPKYKAFCHVNEDYFLAGGWRAREQK